MKSALLSLSLTDLVLLLFVWWFGSYACAYMFTASGLKPLYSYIAIIIFASIYLLGQGATRRSIGVFQDKWLRYFLVWLIGYGMWGGFTFLVSSQSKVAVQSLITLIEVSLVAASFTILMFNPRRYRQVRAGYVVLALFSVAMNVFDFISPTFSNVPGRGAGLYVNPTTAGYMVALAMLGGVESLPKRFRIGFVLACGVGILVTFTRSAWILWGIGVMWLGMHKTNVTTRRRLLLRAAAFIFGAGVLFSLFTGNLGALVEQTSVAHYLDSNTLARLGVGASSISGDSADQRADVALFSVLTAAQSPFVGHGIGFTNEWNFPVGPHNMYLLFIVEGGVIGLLLYVTLMLLLWRGTVGIGKVIALQIIIAGFFSHNLLDQPAVVMMVGYALVQSSIHRRPLREIDTSHTKVPV